MRRPIFVASLLAVILVVTQMAAAGYFDQVADFFPLVSIAKKVMPPEVPLGASFDVEVTLANIGQGPAYDVVLRDLLVNGTTIEREVDVLAAGESVKVRYTVVPTALGMYQVGVTHATYNMEQGNADTQARAISNLIREETAYFAGEHVDDNSFRGAVTVLTPEQYARRHRGRVFEIVLYVFLGAIPALFPYIFYRVKRSEEDVLLRRAKYMK